MLKAFRERGLRPLKDLRIIGYDDLLFLDYSRPGLTTIRQPLIEEGRTAARLLVDASKNPGLAPVHRFFAPELIVRDTA